MLIYDKILQNFQSKKTGLAVLIDPDKVEKASLEKHVQFLNKNAVDYIFVGGSLISSNLDECVQTIKSNTSIPVLLFPGSVIQISKYTDAILFLSLISGRNPEFLIGNQVVAAPFIKSLHIETISTGYILIENGNMTSVEYMSNTKPIPRNKPDLVVATALAGEMLGHKVLYLESGSGAKDSIPIDIIQKVKENVSIPLIIGGGIKTPKQSKEIKASGADIIVLGSIIEQNPELLPEFMSSLA
jgi:phosphoglycerol geranylgeranyltransferase